MALCSLLDSIMTTNNDSSLSALSVMFVVMMGDIYSQNEVMHISCPNQK